MAAEIKKISCPSCGASLEWSASQCSFCGTQVRYFEEGSSALPLNLSAEDIEKSIVLSEREFYEEIGKARKAPYSLYKEVKHSTPEEWKKDFRSHSARELKLLFDTFFILPGENLVLVFPAKKLGPFEVILTSLRLIIIRTGSLLSIPLENLIYWKGVKWTNPEGIIGRDGSAMNGYPELKYFRGEREVIIKFDPCDLYPQETIVESVINCKEWEDLTPLQKNLLSVSRYNIEKSYKIEIKPFEMMSDSSSKIASLPSSTIISTSDGGIFSDKEKFKFYFNNKKSIIALILTGFFFVGCAMSILGYQTDSDYAIKHGKSCPVPQSDIDEASRKYLLTKSDLEAMYCRDATAGERAAMFFVGLGCLVVAFFLFYFRLMEFNVQFPKRPPT